MLSVTKSIRMRGTESFYQPLKKCLDQSNANILSWDEFKSSEFMGNYAYETVYELPIVALRDSCILPDLMASAISLRHPLPFQRDRKEIRIQLCLFNQASAGVPIGRWGVNE